MIVELFGLPGSGKSTLAKRCAAHGAVVVRAPSRGALLSENLAFVLEHPIRSMRALGWLLRYAPPKLRYSLFVNAFLVHNAKYRRARRISRTGKVAVLDQGHLQNLLSIPSPRAEPPSFDTYVSLLPKPHLVVALAVSRDERERRLSERGRLPREEFGAHEAARFAKASEAAYPLALEAIARAGIPCTTIEDGVAFNLPRFLTETLTYATTARMPTEKAHGVSIAHMCAVFAGQGVQTRLVLPTRRNTIAGNLYEYYGVPRTFTVDVHSVPDFIGKGWTHPMFFLVQRLFFLVHLVRKGVPVGTVYTRDPEVAWMFSSSRRTVFEAHRWPAGISGRLQAYLVRHAALVVCNSRGTEAAARRAGCRRTLVAPNGFDPALFNVAQPDRASLGLPSGFLALYVGSDAPWKGASVLQDAAAGARHVTVAIVGGKQVRARENLLELGRVSPTRVPAYLKAADALVLPNTVETEESERYTSPIKLFEYLAAGKPIIASDLPSIREILHEDDAYFVPPGDAVALRDALELLAGDDVLRAHLAKRAVALSSRYTWQARAARIIGELQERL